MPQESLLVLHSTNWKILYGKEALSIKEIFGDALLKIEHIGSTSIPDILAKPIIDIAVQIQDHKDADKFIEPLKKLGYFYKPEKSSVERHFFQKGDPINFHLSIAYLDRGGYWNRQILFRDYLISHEDARREYEHIKLEGLSKRDFVQKILSLAEPEELECYNIDKPGTIAPWIAEFLQKRGWTWGLEWYKDENNPRADMHHFEKVLGEIPQFEQKGS